MLIELGLIGLNRAMSRYLEDLVWCDGRRIAGIVYQIQKKIIMIEPRLRYGIARSSIHDAASYLGP